jgi:hypothetical protein
MLPPRVLPPAGSLRYDNSAIWQHRVLGNQNDPISHDPILSIQVGARLERFDHYIGSQAGILIDNGALNMAIGTDAQGNLAAGRVSPTGAHQDTARNTTAICNLRAQADDHSNFSG